jgi:hypothetical protein
MTISNEAVEAASKVFFEDGWEGPPYWASLDADDPSRLEYLATTRLALEAAAGIIRAECLEEAAEALRLAGKDIDPWGKPTRENYADWISARAVAERGRQ